MPRLQDAITRCAFYLYPDAPSAEDGRGIGGTGFLIAKRYNNPRLSDEGAVFAVSNRHVVEKLGASVVRLPKIDGTNDIIELMPEDWEFHPTADLAATCSHIQPGSHLASWAMYEHLITHETAASFSIGIGDDVFMVGRFIGHDGKTINRPSVRFGNISVGAAPIYNEALGHEEESYAIDMRSKPGYSGSPVFVYGTPQLTTGPQLPREAERFLMLLGANWGHIVEPRPLLDKAGRPSFDGGHTLEATGMCGVVPGWRIAELLDAPPLARRFFDLEQRRLSEIGSSHATSVPMSAGTVAIGLHGGHR